LDTSLIINLISQQFQIWVLFDLFVITATTSKAKVKQASKQASLSNGNFLAAGFQIFFFCCLLLLLCSDILLFKPIELEFSLWFFHSDWTHFEYFVTIFFWLWGGGISWISDGGVLLLLIFKQHSSPVASSQDQSHVFARLQGE
jgi:hypothetical protein